MALSCASALVSAEAQAGLPPVVGSCHRMEHRSPTARSFLAPSCHVPGVSFRVISLRGRGRGSSRMVPRMAPDEEKMTRRSPLDFPVEWDRPGPARRPDVMPQFSPMKPPLPQPLPADPPEEDEEEEGEKEAEPDPDKNPDQPEE